MKQQQNPKSVAQYRAFPLHVWLGCVFILELKLKAHHIAAVRFFYLNT
ncbi:hypothetical protein SC127_18695 [Pantoea sp. T14]|nr:hypothetical protein [Pantoea bituminis]